MMQNVITISFLLGSALFISFCINMMDYFWNLAKRLAKTDKHKARIAKLNWLGISLIAVFGLGFGIKATSFSLDNELNYLIGTGIGLICVNGLVARWLKNKQDKWNQRL